MPSPAPPSDDASDSRPAYRRFRAPSDTGAALIDPSWPDLRRLIDANRQRSDTPSRELLGLRLDDLITEARPEFVRLAWRHTREFCDVDEPAQDVLANPLIVAGHQPELFHPGVWFKNFALDEIARESGGVGVHVLIDSDLCRRVSVHAPCGPIETPSQSSVAYDSTGPDLPYEERTVNDPALLNSFGLRVAEVLSGLVERPLAEVMTPDLAEAGRATGNLGQTLSRARRLVEQRHGSRTLELPLSTVCDTSAFRRFASALLASAADVRRAYNAALAGYRAAHRLRSPAQPLPDLAEEDGWVETPFWAWTETSPVRRALFARTQGGVGELTDRAGSIWLSPSTPGADWLADLRGRGVKVRSRALITTLYARLVLGDLFLHGIGGAKYDQVTDDFTQRLFGFAPPPHATMTATLRLPVDFPRETVEAPAKLRRQLRELRFHPEAYINDEAAEAQRLVAEKRAAVESPVQTDRSNRPRHERIEQANLALQPFVDTQRRVIAGQLESIASESRAAAILGSREFSFCLFPEAAVCEPLRALAKP